MQSVAQHDLHRSRSPEAERSVAKKARVETATAQTETLVATLSSVNSDVICALRSRLEGIIGSRNEWQGKVKALESLLVTAQRTRAVAELDRIQSVTVAEYQEHAIQQLSEEVSSVAKRASDIVSPELEVSARTALTALEKKVTGETEVNDGLVRQVHSFTHDSLAAVAASCDRSLRAALEATGKDVVIARLQTALSLELARHARYYDEVDALMRIVATLAERSHNVDVTTEALEKAKHRIRALENYLDLNGIIAAVAPPESIPFPSGKKRRGGAPPPKELQARTPHYFAMRMLEHKDMTLSELVEAWQTQEERIVAAENRYAELQETVDSVRQNATLLHQQYVEERQRREISDRRITEMIRERVRGVSASAVEQELSQLRWSYSQVVDDAAQLAVSLKLSREEHANTQKALSAVQQRAQQLARDAQTDKIAATLSELREHYHTSLNSLRSNLADVEVERRILASTVERQTDLCTAARDALEQSRENATALSVEVHTTVGNMNEALATLQAKLTSRDRAATSTEAALGDSVRAVRAAVDELRSQTASLQRSQSSAFTTYGQLINQFIAAVPATSTAAAPSGSAASTAALTESNTLEQIVDTQATAAKLSSMRAILNDAMSFVVENLESADAQQTSLLDASISDAHYVSFLVQKLKEVTEQRDGLRAQLRSANTIIQQNHLTLVGQALMHEVSVQDSLDSAEAAERIASLQEQLSAAQLVRFNALDEIATLSKNKEELESEVSLVTRENDRLLRRLGEMENALFRSREKERGLLASKVDMQTRVASAFPTEPITLLPTATDQRNEEGGEEEVRPRAARGESEEELLTRANTTLEAFLRQFDEQLRAMTTAIQEATARKQTPAAGDSVGAAGGDESADAEKSVADYLARTGLNGVVKHLVQTLQKADLLKVAMEESKSATMVALADASNCDERLLSSETRAVSARERRVRELEAELMRMSEQRVVMEQKLAQTEDTVNKAGEMNQKLLEMIKKLNASREASGQEIRALRQQLAEFTASQGHVDRPVQGEPPATMASPSPEAGDPSSAPAADASAPPAPADVAPAEGETAASPESAVQGDNAPVERAPETLQDGQQGEREE